jgi:hypothetical protein
MPTIFRKTAKGAAEIETRAHRLAPRMRSLLILVDGRRDVDDLKSLIAQQAEETLKALADQGFIEAVGETVKATAAAPPAAQPVPTVAARTTADFEALRRAAVRALNDTLGPSGESLALRMEKARTLEELQPLLSMAAKLIGSARGAAAAQAYAQRFLPESKL